MVFLIFVSTEPACFSLETNAISARMALRVSRVHCADPKTILTRPSEYEVSSVDIWKQPRCWPYFVVASVCNIVCFVSVSFSAICWYAILRRSVRAFEQLLCN